jgi:hypothetical protein
MARILIGLIAAFLAFVVMARVRREEIPAEYSGICW